MKNILVLDNYDSFTYNLVHYIEKFTDKKVDVFRNDKISLKDIEKYDKILLSPGPGLPIDSGILMDLIKTYHKTKSIFGICLGLQAITQVFGGKLNNLNNVFHGVAKKTIIKDPTEPLFKNIPIVFNSGRYHSWVASRENFPECLSITAEDEEGLIMAIKHKVYDVKAVQFHPESILTDYGEKIIDNWINE